MEIKNCLDAGKLLAARREIEKTPEQLILVVGAGAVEVVPRHDLLVYADLARWEIQQRRRSREIGNLAAENLDDSPSQKYISADSSSIGEPRIE